MIFLQEQPTSVAFIMTHSKAEAFSSESEEYECIGKFGRMRWSSEEVMKSFDADDRETFVDIARMFGAFDY